MTGMTLARVPGGHAVIPLRSWIRMWPAVHVYSPEALNKTLNIQRPNVAALSCFISVRWDLRWDLNYNTVWYAAIAAVGLYLDVSKTSSGSDSQLLWNITTGKNVCSAAQSAQLGLCVLVTDCMSQVKRQLKGSSAHHKFCCTERRRTESKCAKWTVSDHISEEWCQERPVLSRDNCKIHWEFRREFWSISAVIPFGCCCLLKEWARYSEHSRDWYGCSSHPARKTNVFFTKMDAKNFPECKLL